MIFKAETSSHSPQGSSVRTRASRVLVISFPVQLFAQDRIDGKMRPKKSEIWNYPRLSIDIGESQYRGLKLPRQWR